LLRTTLIPVSKWFACPNGSLVSIVEHSILIKSTTLIPLL